MVCTDCQKGKHGECANLWKTQTLEVAVEGGTITGDLKSPRPEPVTTMCDCQHKGSPVGEVVPEFVWPKAVARGEVTILEGNAPTCGRPHCRAGMHCRCTRCHDAGNNSLFEDLSVFDQLREEAAADPDNPWPEL